MKARPLGETILLVEDDPPTRSLISRILPGQGYTLLDACNGAAGLRLAEDHRGPIDLLVTDIVMPQMDGFTLGERLVESHPETVVLFMSGYAERSVVIHGRLKEAGQSFQLKPFSRDHLLQTIRERLDTDRSRGPLLVVKLLELRMREAAVAHAKPLATPRFHDTRDRPDPTSRGG